VKHLLYASSSSVYGNNEKVPFSEDDNVDYPVSLYAATKKSNELMAFTYSHLYKIPATGLRFFTVYGPWGRPDMAIWKFTEAMLNNRPIQVYAEGKLLRDFTYIDDIVSGIIAALKPEGYNIINLGGHEVITINGLVSLIEDLTGKKAIVDHGPADPADMFTNWADVSKARDLLGWKPKYDMRMGTQALIEWYLAERHWANQVITL
jgi:UDP-glucuronate 4-epimerase